MNIEVEDFILKIKLILKSFFKGKRDMERRILTDFVVKDIDIFAVFVV